MSTYHDERLPIPTPARLKAELRLRKPPFWMVSGLLIAVAASFIPLALVAWTRMTPKTNPRVHLIQDMDNQPRYSTQQPSAVFRDGRAMRPPVAGTVARGALAEDDHYHRGFELAANPQTGVAERRYFAGLPAQVEVTRPLLERGRTLFSIYCATCHGQDGYGNGPVNQRAVEREVPGWVPPASLHKDDVRNRPEGHLYNTIRNGLGTMPGYGSQIDVADRWAVVTYLRALQRSQHAGVADVPPDRRDQLK